MSQDGPIAQNIAQGEKKLKSLEVSLEFAEKARDEKQAAEDAAAKDSADMAQKVVKLEVEYNAEDEALAELRSKANQTATEYAVAVNSTSAAWTALDAERAALEAN